MTPIKPTLEQASPSFYIAILAPALGSFAIGRGEFVIMGLLPEIAADLIISIRQAAHAICPYAFGVVSGAPLLAIISTRWSRTLRLLVVIGLYASGHSASAFADNSAALLGLRLVGGFPHGTYFGIASWVAASLAPRHMRTQAVAYVMMGLAVATLIGVPFASALGQWLGWRYSFALIGIFALAACVAVWRSEEHTSELQSRPHLVCRLLLEKKKN